MTAPAEREDVDEPGAFAHAVGRSCDWVGPARRSRRARKDLTPHQIDGHETTVRTLEEMPG
jgi:hypothetical protein